MSVTHHIFFNKDSVILASYNELGKEALDPTELICFSEEQYAQEDFLFRKLKKDTPIGWIKGTNITQARDMYIPASIVAIHYEPLNEFDGRVDQWYSTGLAAGSDYISAVHSGLREVIERDAYALHWLTKKSSPKIDQALLWECATGNLRKLLNHKNVNIGLHDVTTDLGIPCVISHLTSPAFSGLASGSCCYPNTYLCTEKALKESFHTLNWCLDMQKKSITRLHKEEIESFEQHVRYYFDQPPEIMANLDFFTSFEGESTMEFTAPKPRQDSDIKAELRSMVCSLKDKNFDVYSVDLTTDELRETDFVVTKVIVPGLQPLYCGSGKEHLDPRRVRQFCKNTGYQLKMPLNTNPHPFP